MITTVTLNPAIDKTYTTARLIPGQVNRMEDVKNLAGGKGINVTKVLRQFDYPVRALGFLGGYTGRFIEDSVAKTGAACEFTHIKEETRSSMNILSKDGYVTELLEPGPSVSEEEMLQFMADYRRAVSESSLIILSGSAPGGVPEDIYRTLTEIGNEAGKTVLLDTSGSFLRQGAEAVPFMIKPNLKELEALCGRKIRDIEEVIHAALQLNAKGIGHILVSMGYKGILYACDKRVLYAKAPYVKAVNTVGCGDSVVAAFAMSLMEQEGMEETLRRCTAVSAANATTLESAVIPVEKAEAFLEKIEIEVF